MTQSNKFIWIAFYRKKISETFWQFLAFITGSITETMQYISKILKKVYNPTSCALDRTSCIVWKKQKLFHKFLKVLKA